jgi:hypothetical protein
MMTTHHLTCYLLIEEMNECETINTRHTMSETHATPDYYDQSGLYEIRLKGQLDERWSTRFGDAIITLEENGNTLLTCLVIDQSALHGLLKRVRDLGMPLLSVNFVSPDQGRT